MLVSKPTPYKWILITRTCLVVSEVSRWFLDTYSVKISVLANIKNF